MHHVKIDERKTGTPTKPPRRYVEEYVDVTVQNNKTVCKVDWCTKVSECKGGFTGKSLTKRSRLRRDQDDYEDVSVTVTHGDADTKVDIDGGRIRLPSNKTGSLGRRNRISSNRTSKGSAKKLKKSSKQSITPGSNNASESSSDSWETDSESDGYSVIPSGHFYRKKSPPEGSAKSTQPELLPRRPSAPAGGATSVTSRLPPRPPVGPVSPGGSGDQNLVRKGQRGAPTSKVLRPSCPPPLPPPKKTEGSCDVSASSPTGSPTKLKHAQSDSKLSQAEPRLNIDFKRPLPQPPTSQSMSPKDSSSEPTLTPLSRSSSSASDWSQSSRSDILVPSRKIGVLPAGKLRQVRDKSPPLPPRSKKLDTESVMEQKSEKLKAELKSVETKESKQVTGLSRSTPSRKTRDATKNWVFGTQSDVPPEPVLPREPKSKWNTKADAVKRKSSNRDAPRLPPRPKTQICLADSTTECIYSEVAETGSERPQRPPRPKSMAANVNLLTVPEKPPRISVCKASDRSSGISDSYMDPFTELASQPTTSHLTVDDPDTDDSEDFCQVYRKGSRFEDEPLYQMYHKGCIMRDMIRGDDADLPEEEEIYIDTSGSSSSGYSSVQTQSSITKDTLAGTLKGIRSLWRELPEVQQSGVIPSMSDQELKCKEALFEIVTSEASYVKSLDLAHDHFMMSDELRHLKKRDRQILFSNFEAVRETSSKLLAALEEELTENILLSFKICDIIKDFALKHFNVYVIYCRNQTYQHRKLKELVASNPEFVANVRHLETDPRCQSLNLMSFLLLPMQRITRLPLLIDAVISRLDMTDDGYPQATTTLQEVNKVVRQCNEGAKQMANMEEVADIMNKLVYKDIKTFPLVSRARYLVKRGMLTHIQRESLGGILPRRPQNLHFYLFNDLLVITKKKSENQYIVVDYTARIHVEAQYLIRDSPSKGQSPGSTKDQKNLFLMVLLENHAGKAVEYILSTKNTSEMTRWVEAVTPPQQVNENEKIYEDWDCPQVQVVSPYTATQPDELNLEESDIINVFRKLNDGMYEGERIRDGQRGWFPASHTKEIHSKHIRAKNLRQRYRLLMLSETKVAERQFQTSKFFS